MTAVSFIVGDGAGVVSWVVLFQRRREIWSAGWEVGWLYGQEALLQQ